VLGGSACQLFDGARTCPAGTNPSGNWFTGFTSSQSCGACACGAPTGASCASAQITVGASGTCGSTTITAGGTALCSTLANPGIQITGATPGTCQAQSAVSGFVTATGPKTLCCL
jgi:hypothetical protein